MSKPTRDPSVVWAGIPSGTYRIHALGAPRDVTVDLTHFAKCVSTWAGRRRRC